MSSWWLFFSLAWNHILCITGQKYANCDFNFAFEQVFFLLLLLLTLDIPYKGFSTANLSSNNSSPSHIFNSPVWILSTEQDCNMLQRTHISCVQSKQKVSWSNPKMLLRCFPIPNFSHSLRQRICMEIIHTEPSKETPIPAFLAAKPYPCLFPKNSKQKLE